MNQYIFLSLGTRSKRAISNVRKQWGHYKHYIPSDAICKSVAKKHQISEGQARIELERIRAYFIEQNWRRN